MWFGRPIGARSDLRTAPWQFEWGLRVRMTDMWNFHGGVMWCVDLSFLMRLDVPLSVLVQGRFVTLTSGDEIWCSFVEVREMLNDPL